MSKQMSAAILLFYCLLRLVSGLYMPSSSRDLAGDTAHYHGRRHDLTTSDDDATAIFGTWYMIGASPNMQNMMVNSNLSAVQGMACGCAYMDLSAGEGTMDTAASNDDDDDQCNNVVDVKTYCDLTSSGGNPSATGQIATIGYAIPENNTTSTSSSGQEITLEYTIDTLILSLGNWSQAPAMNQSMPVNYTMEIHSQLLNASSSSCNDSDNDANNGGSSCGLLSWTDLDSQRYTALYTHEATVNRSVFDDLVKQAGDYGKDLVHLNTTCASSNSTIHNNNM